jgi:hypothetical protein
VKDNEKDTTPTALCAPANHPAEQGYFAAATEEGRWRRLMCWMARWCERMQVYDMAKIIAVYFVMM